MKDPLLSKIISSILKGEKLAPYTISRAALLCKSRNQRGLNVVVPQSLIPMVFRYYHETVFGSHLGICKTIKKSEDILFEKGWIEISPLEGSYAEFVPLASLHSIAIGGV